MDTSIVIWLGIATASLFMYIWKWRHWGAVGLSKYVKWLLAFPIGLFCFFVGTMALNSYEDYVASKPVKMASLRGISLGDSKSDVRFKLGKPTEIQTGEVGEGYFYEDLSQQIVFYKPSDKVHMILHFCTSTAPYGVKVANLGCGATIQQIEHTFGKTDLISVSKDETTRIYSFPKYQVAFGLSKNKVELFAVYDPGLTPEGLKIRGQVK